MPARSPPVKNVQLALLCLLAPGAWAQSPILEPALTLSGDLATSEAGGVQRAPYVAAAGAASLAVWIDHRAEVHSPLANQGGPDLYALRLDAAGQPLDPVAIRLPFAVADKRYPQAAWNGTSWLTTSAGGTLTLPITVPLSVPSGLTILAQAWLLDAAAPFGVAGSNAVGTVAE